MAKRHNPKVIDSWHVTSGRAIDKRYIPWDSPEVALKGITGIQRVEGALPVPCRVGAAFALYWFVGGTEDRHFVPYNTQIGQQDALIYAGFSFNADQTEAHLDGTKWRISDVLFTLQTPAVHPIPPAEGTGLFRADIVHVDSTGQDHYTPGVPGAVAVAPELPYGHVLVNTIYVSLLSIIDEPPPIDYLDVRPRQGAGDPAQSLGNEGDSYLNTRTGDVWFKTLVVNDVATWELKYTPLLRLPNMILWGGDTSNTNVNPFQVTVTPLGWLINNITYEKLTDTVLTLDDNHPLLNRIDVIVATKSGTLMVVKGLAEENYIEPDLPVDTVAVRAVVVSPDGVDILTTTASNLIPPFQQRRNYKKHEPIHIAGQGIYTATRNFKASNVINMADWVLRANISSGGGAASRFGLEDTVADVDRDFSLQGNNLAIINAKTLELDASSPNGLAQLTLTASGGLNQVKFIANDTANGISTEIDIRPEGVQLATPSGFYYLPLTVNGVAADESGNITIETGGGAAVTADNGLTKTDDNIQLGGELTANTEINGVGSFYYDTYNVISSNTETYAEDQGGAYAQGRLQVAPYAIQVDTTSRNSSFNLVSKGLIESVSDGESSQINIEVSGSADGTSFTSKTYLRMGLDFLRMLANGLTVAFPTTYSGGGIVRTLPVSVNGTYADTDGNVTIATGGSTPTLQAVTDVGNTTTNQVKIATTVNNSNYKLLVGGGLIVTSGVMTMSEFVSVFNMSDGRCALICDGSGIQYRLFNNDLTDFPDTSKSFIWRNKGFEHMKLFSDATSLNEFGQPATWEFKTRINYHLYLPHTPASTGAYRVLTRNDATGEVESVLASEIGGGGAASRFGVAGEDVTATNHRSFNAGGFNFKIEDAATMQLWGRAIDTYAESPGFNWAEVYVSADDNLQNTAVYLAAWDAADNGRTLQLFTDKIEVTKIVANTQTVYNLPVSVNGQVADVNGNITIDTVTADNGLTKTGDNIQLGGPLLGNTTIDGAQNVLHFTDLAQVIMQVRHPTGSYANIELHGADNDLPGLSFTVAHQPTTTISNLYMNQSKLSFSKMLNVGVASNYADNAAALTAGLVIGDIYRTGDFLKIVH